MRNLLFRVTEEVSAICFLVASFSASPACSSGTAPARSGNSPSTTGSTSGATTGGTSGSATGSTLGATSGAASGASTGSASGTSAGATSGTTPATSVCSGAGTRVLTSQGAVVDDFEAAVISPGWSSFNDVMPTHDVFKIMQVAGGAAGTAHAGRYAGTGAITTTMGGFGVGTVYNVAIDPVAGIYCIDISAFDGVSFWAKAATAGSSVSLNFVVPQTNMTSNDLQGRPNGGDCNAACFNHPRVTVTLTAGWAQYTAKFSDASGGSAKVTNVVQELAWLSPDSNWDFSLDEITFYKGTPPPGAVGSSPSDAGTAHD